MSSGSSVTGLFFCLGEEARRLQKIGTSNMGEKRAGCDGRVCAHSIRYEAHPAPLSQTAAWGGAIQKTYSIWACYCCREDADTPEHVWLKVPFCNEHSRGCSGPCQRSMHRSAACRFLFFPFLFPMLPTLAFLKVCAGFSSEQRPAESARDNFRNVTPACLSPARRPDPFFRLFFGGLTF